ncbi:MAG: type 4a pilus biogenesis protein PilO [Caldicoprobacterales bacterium]|jgi:type IV pilus assembly protein PilO|nr:hypothetical protein [Clostridiales bacterium]
MKLTKREAFLLKVVGFVALIALSYYFVISPQLDRLAEVELSVADKTAEVESIKQEIQTLPQLDQEIENLQKQVSVLSKSFFPELQQKKLIIILDEQLRDSSTKADSLGFSQLTVVENPELTDADNTQEKAQSEGSNENPADTIVPEIKSLSVDVPFAGSYPQIIDFIRRMEGMNRLIVINNLQIAQGTDGMLGGTINLSFYSLKKLFDDPLDEEYFDWPFNTSMGTDNPFRFIPMPVEEPTSDAGLEETEIEPEEDTTSQASESDSNPASENQPEA